MSWESPIVRVPRGKLNLVNDTVPGGTASIGSRAKFGGQLGKAIWLDTEQALQLSDLTTGTLYGGGYRYVQLHASAGTIKRGQLLFWDNTAAVNLYRVHSSATTTTDITFASLAGFALNVPTAGNYCWIQFAGIATALYVDNITAATTSSDTGNPIFVSTATAGRVDIFDNVAGTQVGDSVTNTAANWWNRFIGWQIDPAEDGTDPRGRIEIGRMFTTRM